MDPPLGATCEWGGGREIDDHGYIRPIINVGEKWQHPLITRPKISNVYTQSIHLTIKTHTKDKKRKSLHSDVKNQYKWLFTALEGIQVIQ